MNDVAGQTKRFDTAAARLAAHPALQHDAAQRKTQILLGLVPAVRHPMRQHHALANLRCCQATKGRICAGPQQALACHCSQFVLIGHVTSMTTHCLPQALNKTLHMNVAMSMARAKTWDRFLERKKS